ncbi:MAG: hypothetical protein P857_768, partial [Candidatus Xenolissoclinum pacificiensis L6]
MMNDIQSSDPQEGSDMLLQNEQKKENLGISFLDRPAEIKNIKNTIAQEDQSSTWTKIVGFLANHTLADKEKDQQVMNERATIEPLQYYYLLLSQELDNSIQIQKAENTLKHGKFTDNSKLDEKTSTVLQEQLKGLKELNRDLKGRRDVISGSIDTASPKKSASIIALSQSLQKHKDNENSKYHKVDGNINSMVSTSTANIFTINIPKSHSENLKKGIDLAKKFLDVQKASQTTSGLAEHDGYNEWTRISELQEKVKGIHVDATDNFKIDAMVGVVQDNNDHTKTIEAYCNAHNVSVDSLSEEQRHAILDVEMFKQSTKEALQSTKDNKISFGKYVNSLDDFTMSDRVATFISLYGAQSFTYQTNNHTGGLSLNIVVPAQGKTRDEVLQALALIGPVVLASGMSKTEWELFCTNTLLKLREQENVVNLENDLDRGDQAPETVVNLENDLKDTDKSTDDLNVDDASLTNLGDDADVDEFEQEAEDLENDEEPEDLWND